MRFYLKREHCASKDLFSVTDSSANLLYRVEGEGSSFIGKSYLVNKEGQKILKISRLGPTALARYTVFFKGKEQFQILQNFAGTQPSFKITKTGWRLRGNFLQRSFDLLAADGTLLMSHRRCFSSCGEYFELQIAEQAEINCCIAVAVIVDSVELCGGKLAQPVSN